MTSVCFARASHVRVPPPRLGYRLTNHTPTAIYIWNKGSIAGPAFKMPFIGPFLQSVNPKFEEYYAKWMSGPLSCVSVFHK